MTPAFIYLIAADVAGSRFFALPSLLSLTRLINQDSTTRLEKSEFKDRAGRQRGYGCVIA